MNVALEPGATNAKSSPVTLSCGTLFYHRPFAGSPPHSCWAVVNSCGGKCIIFESLVPPRFLQEEIGPTGLLYGLYLFRPSLSLSVRQRQQRQAAAQFWPCCSKRAKGRHLLRTQLHGTLRGKICCFPKSSDSVHQESTGAVSSR